MTAAASEIVLECRDVSCGRDAPVLEHVNLAVTRGEVVALLGESGGGKSTLLRTMVGALRPLAGEVLVFGEPLYALGTRARARVLRRMGVAFQEDALFSSLSVGENIALPLRELTALPDAVIGELVRAKLAQVGLGGMEQRLPSQLSGGQAKRVALARATVMDPELVFCDEPTAGLDPIVALSIEQMLAQLRALAGTTLVVISHELDSVRAIASRAILLGRGRVRAVGTVDELAHSADREVHEFFHTRTEHQGGHP